MTADLLRPTTTMPAGGRAAVGWLSLWLVFGPAVVLVPAAVPLLLLYGYAGELTLLQYSRWEGVALAISAGVAVLPAHRVSRVGRTFSVPVLALASATGLLLARLLGTSLPRWLVDDPGEGVNLYASELVVVPQTATLFFIGFVAWSVPYWTLRYLGDRGRSRSA